MKHFVIALFFLAMGVSFGAYSAESPLGVTDNLAGMHQESYVPGMGEIMGATQMRHAKLWFASKNKNWNLASYELDEIKEGLEDAVKYHPVFKKDAPVATLLDKFMSQPLSEIEDAVKEKNGVEFVKAFDKLTSGCNGCHQAAGQGFIVIKRPSISTFSNQEFAVKIK